MDARGFVLIRCFLTCYQLRKIAGRRGVERGSMTRLPNFAEVGSLSGCRKVGLVVVRRAHFGYLAGLNVSQ